MVLLVPREVVRVGVAVVRDVPRDDSARVAGAPRGGVALAPAGAAAGFGAPYVVVAVAEGADLRVVHGVVEGEEEVDPVR